MVRRSLLRTCLALAALATAALLAGFLAREASAATPLVPLRVFRARNAAGANLIIALMVAGMFGMFFLGALYLQKILGYSALQVGLAFLPSCIVMGTLSLGFAERLIMGIGARAALIAGLIFAGGGLLLFARAPVDGTWAIDVLPVMLLLGTGAGLAFPALMTLAMSGATQSDAGRWGHGRLYPRVVFRARYTTGVELDGGVESAGGVESG